MECPPTEVETPPSLDFCRPDQMGPHQSRQTPHPAVESGQQFSDMELPKLGARNYF
jgi:hypothetical protein